MVHGVCGVAHPAEDIIRDIRHPKWSNPSPSQENSAERHAPEVLHRVLAAVAVRGGLVRMPAEEVWSYAEFVLVGDPEHAGHPS